MGRLHRAGLASVVDSCKQNLLYRGSCPQWIAIPNKQTWLIHPGRHQPRLIPKMQVNQPQAMAHCGELPRVYNLLPACNGQSTVPGNYSRGQNRLILLSTVSGIYKPKHSAVTRDLAMTPLAANPRLTCEHIPSIR